MIDLNWITKKEDKLEFRRQLFHLIAGLLVVVLVYFDVIDVFILLLLFVIGVLLSLVAKKRWIPLISHLLDLFERPNAFDVLPGKGALFLLLGVMLSLVLFPKNIALASISILAVGDSVSHLFGRFWGAVPHPLNTNKMIEGTIVGTFLAFLVAALFVSPVEAFLAALIAMVFEAVEYSIWKRFSVDDNLVLPLIAGIVIILIRRF